MAFCRALDEGGLEAEVSAVSSLAEARARLEAGELDCAVVDLGLPDGSGMDLLGARGADGKPLPTLVLTGIGDDARGVEAMRRGAEDFLVKGEYTAGSLARAVRFAIERGRARPRTEWSPPSGCGLRVRRQGAAGVEAVLLPAGQSEPHRVRSANRSVLFYLLGRKLAEDRAEGVPRSDEGWCSDLDVAIGIWGRTDADTARNRLHVLIHRVRKKFERLGLGEELIETRRAAVRGRFQRVEVED